MKLYNFENVTSVYMIGDIHGEFKRFIYKIKAQLNLGKRKLSMDISNELDKKLNFKRIIPLRPFTRNELKDSLIFVAGDCGFGFNKEAYYKDQLTKLNDILSEKNNYVIFVRGNHDDPNYFNNDILGLSNVICVPDYSVIKTKKYTTLCVGGGLSVDKEWRLGKEAKINRFKKPNSFKKKLYWEDEMPIFDINKLNEIKKEGIVIDSVVTHTAPSFVDPKEKSINLNWLKDNMKLTNEAKKERDVMNELYNYFSMNNIELKFWIYGHFHIESFKRYNGILFFALSNNYIIYDIDEELKKYKAFIESHKSDKNDERLDAPSGKIFFNFLDHNEETEEDESPF